MASVGVRSHTFINVFLDDLVNLVLHAGHWQSELLLLLLHLFVLWFDVASHRHLLLVYDLFIFVAHFLLFPVSQPFLSPIFLYKECLLCLLCPCIRIKQRGIIVRVEFRHSWQGMMDEFKSVMHVWVGIIDVHNCWGFGDYVCHSNLLLLVDDGLDVQLW